ncbi:MAG: hypothetical protein NT009_01760, partial [Proteobacteria bacterium]|nr:hypothetical protein [Pseudomonadota bacterium]
EVAAGLRTLLKDREAQKALTVLERDFHEHDGLGPLRVAEFLQGGPDEEIQADVVGFIRRLLTRCAGEGLCKAFLRSARKANMNRIPPIKKMYGAWLRQSHSGLTKSNYLIPSDH